MSWISGFCFGIFFLLVITMFRRATDVFSPARMFLLVWAVVIGLAELKFSRLQQVWPADVWLQVLAGPAAFLVGLFAAYVLNLRTPLLTIGEIRQTWRTREIQGDRLFWTVTVMFALYLLAFLVILLIKGVTPPLFSARPGLARLNFTMFGIGLFLHNVAPVMFLSAVFVVCVPGNRLRKRLLILMSLVAATTYFTLLQRFQLMMGAAMCVVLVYYTTRHLRWSTILPYALGAVGLFYWVSTLRSAMRFFVLYLYQQSKMTIPLAYAWATEPYMYFVMNVENLARGIQKLDHYTYGYYSFNFLFSLSGLKHWIEEYFVLDDTPYLVSGYNTYTSFWVYYRDFGLLGVTFFPLVVGFAIGAVYYAMRNRPGLEIIALYSLGMFLIFFSFFNNPLSLLWFVYSLVVTLIGFRIILKSRPVPGEVLPGVAG
jgi:oligosaccharide repeat unit polymerase